MPQPRRKRSRACRQQPKRSTKNVRKFASATNALHAHRHQGLHQVLWLRTGRVDAVLDETRTHNSGPVVLAIPPGVAHAFRQRGAEVHVWGTRPRAEDYAGVEGSDLTGLHYACVDVGEPDQIDSAPQPGGDGATLDVLVLCQGTVAYKRAEFERAGWDRVMAVNVKSIYWTARHMVPHFRARGGGVPAARPSLATLGWRPHS